MDKEYHKQKSLEHYRKNKATYIKNAYGQRRKRKEKLVELAGGKCVVCGYNKCVHALEFHHLDPKLKTCHLGKLIGEVGLEKLKEEAKKCILLCSNCHKEIEYGVTKLGLVANAGLAIDF